MKKFLLQLTAILFFFLVGKTTLTAQNLDFTQDIQEGCAPLTVTFTYTGTNPNANRIDWYFNDGSPMVSTTLPIKSVTHTFTTAGSYYPYIYVYNSSNTYINQTYSSAGRIDAIGAPTISSSSDSTCVNEEVNFQVNGKTLSVSWNFGDGATSTDNYPAHAYTTLGTKTVTLTANTSCGNFTVTKKIYVTNLLTPKPIIYDNTNGPVCPNYPINFQSYDPFVTYSWNFGDGSTSNQQYPMHAYTTVGTKTITLVVTNGCGKSGTTTSTVTIANGLGFPNGIVIYSDSPKYCPGEEAQGYLSTNSSFLKYIWNFGDGSPLDSTSGDSYRHTFFTVGTYTVSCKIRNYCGKDSTILGTVNVSNNVFFENSSWFKLNITSSPSCPNSNVEFNAPSGYNSYVWNYGDGSPQSTTTNYYSDHFYGSTLTTYTVSVKITNLCGKDTTLYSTIKISNPAAFPNNSNFKLYAYESPTCPNSNVSFNAPYGFNNYVWNFGDGTPLLTSTNSSYNHTYGNTITTYTASVKITNSCGNDSTLYTTIIISGNIPYPNQSWFKLNGPSHTVCPGDEMNWNAPSGYVKYEWTFGDGTNAISSNSYAKHNYLSVGTYTASVKITNACGKDTTLSANVVISATGSFSSNLNLYTSPSTSVCPNDLVTLSFSGDAFKSYFWNFGDGDTLTTKGENIQHSYSSTGIYYVSCKVKNGCGNSTTVNAMIQVTNNSPINSSLSIMGISNPACIGDKVFLIMKSGQPNYTYVWNYGDGSPKDTTIGTSSDHVFTTLGNHTVTVTATNGCGLSKTVSMVQVISNTVTPSLKDKDGSRNWGTPTGDDNGSTTTAGCSRDNIIFYFMGESANNIWDFGDGTTGTATESMLVYGGDGGGFPVTLIKHSYAANGTYKLKLTLTNGCNNSVTDSMTINIGGNQVVNGDLTTSPPPYTTCASVDFLAFGGATYGWNFGDGSPTLNTSSPTISHTFSSQGIYLVNVLVTNGCGNKATYSRSVNVTGVGGPAVSLSSFVNPTCVNDNNGSAVITVTNGEPPYMYSWNDKAGQTTATATGLSAGMYSATVIDNIGCKSTLAVSINNPAPTVMQVSTTTTGCGGSTGTASVSISSGGTGPFTYKWSTGETATTATGLSSGAYSVIATDSKGCKSSLNVSISESGGATLTVASSTDISCNGSSTGTIDLNVSGGVVPYTYAWSNGSTAQDPTGLSAGNYSVQVIDNNGCKAILNKTITQPTVLVAATSVTASPTCGNFDGTASATGSGGTGPYTYLWDPGAGSNKTTQSVSGLPAGSYTVTVTDSKGCSKNGEVSLSNSNAPNITEVITNVSCNGGSNGAINITVTGGTSPYLYTWNVSPPNTQDKTNLGAGNYLVFVNDAAGCMSFRNYTITQPEVLSTTATGTGATCFTNNGTATAIPVGGNLPYSYLWTGGKTTQTATGLSVGNYTVTVTDSKGCTAAATKSIAVEAVTPSICMVTVDDASLNNIIYWDKTQYQHVDSFIVYREVSANVYKRIAALKDTALSQYIDVNRSVGPANGDPNVGAYRYKLRLRDSCGNYSAFSPYHNTIYIQDGGNGQFDWNLPYTIEGGANPVANYDLICDLANTEAWFSTGVVAGTQSSATDPGFLTRPNTARWRVKTVWSISCTPTRTTINTTRSNIKSASATVNIANNVMDQLQIYPNPVSESLTIQFSARNKKYQLQIVNALGQVVYNEQLSGDVSNSGMITKEINVNTFSKGIYIINLQTENGNIFQRLAIQ